MSQKPESSQRNTPISVELPPSSETKTPSSSQNETGVKTGEEELTSAGPKPFLTVRTSDIVLEKSFKDVKYKKEVSNQTSVERISNVYQQTSFQSLQTKDSNLSNIKTIDLPNSRSASRTKQAESVSLLSTPSIERPLQRLDLKNAKYKVKQAQGYGYQQGYPQYPPQQGYAPQYPPQQAYPQQGYFPGYQQAPPPQRESGGCWKKVCCLGSCAACCMLLCASCLGAAMDEDGDVDVDV